VLFGPGLAMGQFLVQGVLLNLISYEQFGYYRSRDILQIKHGFSIHRRIKLAKVETRTASILDLSTSIQLQVYIENSVSLKTRKFRKFAYSIFSTTPQITDIHLAAHKYASLPFNTFGNAARTGPELLLVGRLIPSTVSSPLPPSAHSSKHNPYAKLLLSQTTVPK
jgi:hypothetical protein